MAENEKNIPASALEAENTRNYMSDEAKWYVVHTYSGYENKVKEDLEKSVDHMGLQEQILEVKYPTEETVEITDSGKRKVTQRKVYPGYVMVKMFMNDKTWYVVRNTRGVTGFVGPGRKPIPLSDEEVTAMGVERIPIVLHIEVGEHVRVLSGPLENFIGKVEALDIERQKIKLTVSMFGRETPVELDFVQVKKL